VEYLIRVDEKMRVLQVVNDKAVEIAPLSRGTYLFKRVCFPMPVKGQVAQDWLVLKEEYEAGVTIGRSVIGIEEGKAPLEEGFVIEEIIADPKRRRKEREPQPTR
jgi:hypothetical protein